jgi:GTP cyclohydrolase I
VQERLTNQIAAALKEALQTHDVAVIIDAVHLCVASRGIKDTNSSTHHGKLFRKFPGGQRKDSLFSAARQYRLNQAGGANRDPV